MQDLYAALCLVLVIEGLFLFALPRAWKRMAEQMQMVETAKLRTYGGVMIALGLLTLHFVR